eukprot:CAMPEP_0170138738 /NCGR_PEP_ID=MMETSP0033_2-20121228/5146_1 /TAXON_ID=195969 /ORGANISM="Dolichomastix tenuilepis, Strain CCMP3274" /LENGTH=62 /DNA_ID=CAMNT_0010374779 /DNA_START=1 /DNA_END=189 /DNA_ORIENTATION=+
MKAGFANYSAGARLLLPTRTRRDKKQAISLHVSGGLLAALHERSGSCCAGTHARRALLPRAS